MHTLWTFNVNEVRRRSVYDLLQNDGKAVDVRFLGSVDGSFRHTK